MCHWADFFLSLFAPVHPPELRQISTSNPYLAEMISVLLALYPFCLQVHTPPVGGLGDGGCITR